MRGAIDHIDIPRSDTSTTTASPVRSRCNSAPAIPPARAMPEVRSPYAGPGIAVGVDAPAGVVAIDTPPRAQNAELS